MIVHCMKKSTWEKVKNEEYWGKSNLESEGFIHCSTVEYLWRVLPNFEDTQEDLVLVCLDEKLLQPEVRYEDGDNCGRYYPHVYGLINNSAVTMVLDYLKDSNGHYRKNPEFAGIEDK